MNTPLEARRRDLGAKAGLALFIACEAMFFAGLLSAWVVFRGSVTSWPPLGQPRLPVMTSGILGFTLLLSAGLALAAGQRLRRGLEGAFPLLNLALVFGLMFLLGQGREWHDLLRFGFTLRSGVYGGLFYTILGIHALHAMAGLACLAWAALGMKRGQDALLGLELAAGFWAFVALLWPVIYGLVYLW